MMAALVDEDMEHGFNCTFMELKLFKQLHDSVTDRF